MTVTNAKIKLAWLLLQYCKAQKQIKVKLAFHVKGKNWGKKFEIFRISLRILTLTFCIKIWNNKLNATNQNQQHNCKEAGKIPNYHIYESLIRT